MPDLIGTACFPRRRFPDQRQLGPPVYDRQWLESAFDVGHRKPVTVRNALVTLARMNNERSSFLYQNGEHRLLLDLARVSAERI